MRCRESEWNFQTLGFYFMMMEFGNLENFQDESSHTTSGSPFSFRGCSKFPHNNGFLPVSKLIMGRVLSRTG